MAKENFFFASVDNLAPLFDYWRWSPIMFNLDKLGIDR